MAYTRILVTLDGSELSEVALRAADKLATPKAQIHILSITTDEISEFASLADAIGPTFMLGNSQMPPVRGGRDVDAIHAREAYLNRVGTWLADKGYEVTVEARPGNVIDTIVSVARDDFEVVVMATHGRTGLMKLALGSVAEGVVHKAPCPVLLIPVCATVL